MHVTPWFTPLPQLSVINDPVPLTNFFPLAAGPEVSSDHPTQCACAPDMLKRLIIGCGVQAGRRLFSVWRLYGRLMARTDYRPPLDGSFRRAKNGPSQIRRPGNFPSKTSPGIISSVQYLLRMWYDPSWQRKWAEPDGLPRRTEIIPHRLGGIQTIPLTKAPLHACKLDYKTACTIATSIVHSKLDYCNSLLQHQLFSN